MKTICTKCKGEGLIPDMAERVFTFGISWLFDKLDPQGGKKGWEKCPRCNGKGYLKF